MATMQEALAKALEGNDDVRKALEVERCYEQHVPIQLIKKEKRS